MSWHGFAWRTAVSRISQQTDESKYELYGILQDLKDNVSSNNKEALLHFINKDVIGSSASFEGPFGRRKIVYCDYIASGKAVNSIEQFMMKRVLPMYANTHTQSSVTGSQTSSFREESKDIIREAVNADEDDAVIFTGSGVTGAVHKLISVLKLKQPPVIFCGPFEHHSNLLPWRELNGHVIQISENANGKVDMRHLEMALKFWSASGRPMIGSFSAASNITGVLTDTRKVAAMLHKYGAISLWDFATAAPYLDINMHPEPYDGYDTSKDAIFISTHKFVGSPDAPGLLIASNHLFQNDVPSNAGGGTVLFVSENDHKYLKDIETREEGGTPAIIGSIRAGLAFKLKMAVGCDAIMSREKELYSKAMKVWKDIPELEILGVLDRDKQSRSIYDRIAVFSFLIKHPQSGRYLHYNFVAELLNDLFGIQSRGGCACAGVYAQHLLGIDDNAEKRFGALLVEDPEKAKRRKNGDTERTEYEITRPGFTRLNFPYFISNEEADFIISAVGMVAKNGWTLLPQYKYYSTSGRWIHVDYEECLEKTSLSDVSFNFDGLRLKHEAKATNLPTSRIDCLKNAERIFFNATMIAGKDIPNQTKQFSDPSVKDLRWFLLPYEAQAILRGKKIAATKNLIFQVRKEITPLSDDGLRASLTMSNGYVPATKKSVKGKDLIDDNEVVVKHKKDKKKRFDLKSLFCKTASSVDIIPATS